LMVTPEAPKPMEPVIALALALGPARTTAHNAAAHIVGIVLMVRFIIVCRFLLLSFSTVESQGLKSFSASSYSFFHSHTNTSWAGVSLWGVTLPGIAQRRLSMRLIIL
jgi:hypothetical protein